MRTKTLLWMALGLVVVFNLGYALAVLAKLRLAFSPLFIGLVTAVTFDIPMSFLEKRLLRRLPRRFARPLALSVTVSLFFAVIAGILVLVIPELAESINRLATTIPQIMQGSWVVMGTDVLEYIRTFSAKLFGQLQEYLPRLLQLLSLTASGILRVLIGIFVGIFMLSAKEELLALTKRVGARVLSPAHFARATLFFAVARNKFGAFLAGQIVEAFIFGTACYLVFALFSFPFALLIGVIMGVVNLIPMVGGYIGGVLCFAIIFTVAPDKAIWFVPIIVALQQLEQITTYPLVVGRNVKLNCFWVLISVTVGGLLFGFVGVFLSVPLTATILAIEERASRDTA